MIKKKKSITDQKQRIFINILGCAGWPDIIIFLTIVCLFAVLK